MAGKLEALIGDSLEASDFLDSVQRLGKVKGKSRLFGDRIRPLTGDEITALEKQGNRAHSWDAVRVAEGFKADFIFGSMFIDRCVIGIFGGVEVYVDGSTILPSGIYRSTIVNSEIGNDCLIHGAGLLSNYVVHEGAVIYQSGAVVSSGDCDFGNGREISVGIETGGREVLSYAEMTIPVAEAVAKSREDKEFIESYESFVKDYTRLCSSPFGIVEGGSIIRHSAKIEGTYVGKGVVIDGATLVQNCTILGTPEEKTEISHGAYVRSSCLQWGCKVTSMAIVDDSVLTEHSHVERHGKVTQSIIGPNTGVAEGEVTSCLVGPFVGFHHQALLIAALWPEGKGNVGYGANVGSNHTSKAPDQEIWCGEGVFFGLGVNIKFPADFTGAPYTIIATAVETLPQKLEFPFSLINKPSRVFDGISPAFNEIIPGWVLSDNIYIVRRNEGKYKKRNKARRTIFDFEVFRPEIIDKMVVARNRLRDIEHIKDLYTEEDLPGLGKNYLLEGNRIKGIKAYDFYIEYYALLGLQRQVEKLLAENKNADLAAIYKESTSDHEWEHTRKILIKEGYDRRSVIENLRQLDSIQERIAQDTQRSKARDDIRGLKIIKDYPHANTQAAGNAFVKETWEEAKRFRERIEKLIADLSR